MNHTDIFNHLWVDYIEQNPHAKRVYDLLVEEGEEVLNDHIAFRTFNDKRININVLSKVFILNGYEEKGNYTFETKHLFAKHFEHKTDEHAPRVFISELILEEFSFELQNNIKKIINAIPQGKLFSDDLIYSGNIWGNISYETYNTLRKESEYAAWVYVFGYCANHFTVNVNKLKKFNSIEKVNSFLKNKGFLINDSEGEIKGTPEELLEQSSIRSGLIKVNFNEGPFEIPSCYYEFAKRYPDLTGSFYSGFIAKSADKIFESTDFYKE